MVTDTPTGSITGQHDWEWNQRRSESPSKVSSDGPASRHRPAKRSGGTRTDRQTVEALQRENRRLETEIARTERRLACVVDQYERRLADKNRQLANRPEGSTRRSDRIDPSNLLARVLRWITDR